MRKRSRGLGRSRRAQKFGDLYAHVTSDIYNFARACGYEPSHQHRQLLDAIMRAVNGTGMTRIAVKSGQGPGKTKCSGLIGLWLMLRDPWCKVIVTAPTMRQCKDAWHAEAKLTMRNADPRLNDMFEFTNTGIGVMGQKPADWGCLLVTSTNPENAAGQHRKDMHIIAEEASGIHPEIMQQYMGTLSNPNGILLQIGNPTSRDCYFFDCFNSIRDMWDCYTWNAEETPASDWFSPTRNYQLAQEFGRNSDVYRIRVLGEFPHSDPNCIMSSDDVQACMVGGAGGASSDHLLRCSLINPRVKQFGIDLARFGGDENVVLRRSGNAIVEKWWQSRVDPIHAIRQAFKMQVVAGWRDDEVRYVADAGGMGQGIMHVIREARKPLEEFQSHHKSPTSSYGNRISQSYFHLGGLLKGRHAALPFDNQMLKQLCTRQYFTNLKGKLVIESKDDYMKRGHDSPDRADGAVLAFVDGSRSGGNVFTRASAPVAGGRVVA